ncbi:sugar-phosphatase [Bacillus sp. ISL-51]|uniref:sugar-phosphatase n=1 Tax=Bacteria TaxID=2 RepID=UPI001BEB68F1|nr:MULTISPECIES: sugar-phosphatase [Bacteria]MBT2574928.1 sugar-phosphatase [Bacillus sp. ISL-51]MBT2634170.1 sugar-phosphatase [Bacillus sp. ISL-26]MBT2713735.1 sugar-phosphatase [Pseudomonas sp. ISL-88]
MYKLIAIDMDGTLLNDHHEVTAEVREALNAAKAAGVNIVLCTGRPLGGVQRYLDELNLKEEGDYVIAYNGALVQNTYTNGVVAEQSLGFEDLQSLHELSLQLDTPMHYFDSANLYTLNRDISEYTVYESYITKVPLHFRTIEEVPKDILIPKIMFIDDPEKLDKTVESIPEPYREKYTMVKSAPFFYEILHPKVSKGNAVKLLAEQLGIEQKQVMAIGDNGNDLSMIKWAGCGVAMANAIPEAREIADYETKSNNEHGVAHAIQELVLKK